MVYSYWLGPEKGPGLGRMGCMVFIRTFHTAPEQGQGRTQVLKMCPVFSGAVWKVLIKTIQPILPGPCAMWKVLHNTSPGSCPGPGSGPSQCEYTIRRCGSWSKTTTKGPLHPNWKFEFLGVFQVFDVWLNLTSHGSSLTSWRGRGWVNRT